MMRFSSLFIALFIVFLVGCDSSTSPETDPPPQVVANVTVSIDVDQERSPISPYIYGSNQDRGSDVWTVRRLGGNRLTGYNWENNFSNAGEDWQHTSDGWLMDVIGVPGSEANDPARVMTLFHEQSLQMSAASVITLQMGGYVSADNFGPVNTNQAAPSSRWIPVEPKKPTPFADTPDKLDRVVYMDELVDFLVKRFGDATSPNGIRWYSLDNEPALWTETHPRILPDRVTLPELIERSADLATAVKDVDPNSEILGPALYGFAAYRTFQDAADWPTHRQNYDWFIDYYLAEMKRAEEEAGRRLLDVLDVHWYPEAQGDSRIIGDGVTNPDIEARLQAPRSLWDASYKENSWIADCCSDGLPIIPRLLSSINRHYPDTKLSISEYRYGGGAHISGGLAQADALGVFGREGIYLASMWGIESKDNFTASAFRLYRDFDGAGNHFGNTSVQATTDDNTTTSVYAAIEGSDTSRLHVILLNKSRAGAAEISFQIASDASYSKAEQWTFSAQNALVTRGEDVSTINGNSFTFQIGPLTATHLILE